MIDNKPKRLFDITVFIAIVPAYIYFISFLYEFGYCIYFGIPKYLIEPSLTTILIFATTFFGILFTSSKLLGFSLPFFKAADNKEKTHLRGINLINGICLFGSILMLNVYPWSWELFFILVAITLFLNLLIWGIPLLIVLRKKKPMKEKLQEVEDNYINNPDENDLLVFFLRFLNKSEKNLFLIIITITVFSFFLGNGDAMKQKDFQKISTTKNTIILRKYNDIFVCAKFDNKTKKISDSLTLIKISDAKPLTFNTIKIDSKK